MSVGKEKDGRGRQVDGRKDGPVAGLWGGKRRSRQRVGGADRMSESQRGTAASNPVEWERLADVCKFESRLI